MTLWQQAYHFDDLLAPARDIPAGQRGLVFLALSDWRAHSPPRSAGAGSFCRSDCAPQPGSHDPGCTGGSGFRAARQHGADQESAGLGEIQQVRVSGGGARSALWRQILSDVMDVELVTVNTTEGAAFGAALLAGVGVGVWYSVDESCQAVIRTSR